MVRFALVCGGLLLLLLLPLFAPFAPSEVHLDALKLPPSALHWLGTDFLGRDEFSRLLVGLRNSVLVGLASGLLALVFSLVFAFGVLFAPKWGQVGLLGFLEGFLALPNLLLILLFSAFSQRGLGLLALSGLLSLFLWPQMAKVLADSFREIATREFIANERALGASKLEIAFGEILPLAKNSVFVLLANTCAHAISAEALLSFFGLGLKVGEASLGNMLNEATQAIFTGVWWLVLVPGVAVFVVVFALAWAGERARA
ncbi:Putative peptide ABC-transport system permease protein [Helicobacter heilmannii]|nr:Putative peptide ABC-transport system permease protein [Helicobacter heilmannii]CRF50791.1 Putative peptide ABC-transport system permease protein [Helicobacter heilmannii]